MMIPKRIRSAIADRFVSYLSSICDLMIQLELEFHLRLDAERLAKAVDLALDAEPVLGCRFVRQWRRPYWERLDQHEREPLLLTDDPEEYESFKHASIDTHRGPQVKACLWRSPAGDRLLLKVAHVAADVGGVKEIAAIVSSVYSRLADDPAYRPEPNLKGSRGLWQVLRNVPWYAYPRIYLDFLRDTLPQIIGGGVHALPLEDGPRTSLRFIQHLLPADRVTQLAEYGRARQATLNDMVLAAFFRALAVEGKWDGRLRLWVTTTVDLRRWYLPSGQGSAVTNLSGFEYPSLGMKLGDDFESTLRHVCSVTRRQKQHWIGLHDWVGLLPLSIVPYDWGDRLYRKVVREVAKRRTMALAYLTNMGAISPESVSFGASPRNACMLPPPGYPPYLVGGLTGYEGTLTLSAGTYAAAGDTVDRFFSQVLSQLPA